MNIEHLKSTDNFLSLEYGYVQANIMQTVQDRYSMLNFYITIGATVATLSVGLLTVPSIDQVSARNGIGFIGLLMWLVGLVFLLIMIRLRQAWYSAAKALNKIKTYYINQGEAKLADAVKWKENALPPANQLWNIHFYSAFLVIAINSGFIALTALVLLNNVALSVILASANMLLQVVFYRVALARNI